jgi:hypothetical protein
LSSSEVIEDPSYLWPELDALIFSQTYEVTYMYVTLQYGRRNALYIDVKAPVSVAKAGFSQPVVDIKHQHCTDPVASKFENSY